MKLFNGFLSSTGTMKHAENESITNLSIPLEAPCKVSNDALLAKPTYKNKHAINRKKIYPKNLKYTHIEVLVHKSQ